MASVLLHAYDCWCLLVLKDDDRRALSAIELDEDKRGIIPNETIRSGVI